LSFLRFLLCVLLCALLGAAAGFFAVLGFVEGMDRLTGHVMGGGGLGTVAVSILAGLVWGLAVGSFAVTRLRGLLVAVAASITFTLGGIMLVLGLSFAIAYAGLPTPVSVDGRRIVLTFEIMAPAIKVRPAEGGPGWRVQVDSWHGVHERQRARLDWANAQRDGDRRLIPGHAAIGNPGKRLLTLYCEVYLSGSQREVPLPEEPAQADMAWSDWQPSLERAAREDVGHCGYPLRYRLRFADERP